MNKVEIHKRICAELSDIYERKNADYGDSFAKLRNEIGDWVILVRLADKLERLKTLLGKREEARVNESIDDTLMDLANYCIMELIERRREKQ